MKHINSVLVALCVVSLCYLAQSQNLGLPTAGMRVLSNPSFPSTKAVKSVLSLQYPNGTGLHFWGGYKLQLSNGLPDTVPTDLWTASSATDYIQSIIYDERRSSILFCTLERTVWVYPWPSGTPTRILFDPATSIEPLLGCVYDAERDNLWFIAGGIAVSRSLISSNQASTTAVTTSLALDRVSSIVLDTVNRVVLWTYGDARAQMTPLSNEILAPSFISSQALGIGTFLSSAFDPVQKVIYLGTDIGIGVEVLTSPALTFNRYFVLPSMQFTSITPDPAHATSFWAGYQNVTNTLYVVRVNSDRFLPFSAVSVAGTDRIGPAAIVNSQNALWTPFFSTSTAIFTKIQLTDCGLYVCQQCLTNDPQYCGVCSSGKVCSLSSACSATWQTSGTVDCPVAGAIVPSTGSTDGNDLVTITGQFLENGELLNAAQTSCVFGANDPVTAATVAATFIQCRTPASAASGLTTVRVKYNGNNWGQALNFTYINCGSFSSCDVCTRNLGCGWCMSQGQCTSSSTCSVASTWNTVCPAILGFSPAQSSIRGNVVVQLDIIPQVTADLTYTCDFGFGSDAIVSATLVSSTRLSCATPTISSGVWASMQTNQTATTLGAYLTSITVRQDGKAITSSSANSFAIYDCPTQSMHCEGCSGVLDFTFPECRFCYDSAVTSCQYTDGTCTDSDGTCPNIESLNPPSQLVNDAAVTSVTLTGLFSFSGATPITNLVCMWNVDSTATAGDAQTATGITANSVTCPIPASVKSTVGTYTVSLWHDESGSYSRITSNAEFLVYDCAASGPCSECVSDLRPRCYWCTTSNSLSCRPDSDGSCTNQITDVTTCPALISVTPDAEEISGGTRVTLSGTNMQLSSYNNIACQFINKNDNTVLPAAATTLSDNLMQCTAPTVDSAADYDVSVSVQNVVHTNRVPFVYYECSAETNCASCLGTRNTRCNWCLGACTTDCAVPTPLTCPLINSTIPSESYNRGGQVVRVNGGPFVSSTSITYTCNFGGELGVVVTVADTYIDCLTPTRGGFASFEGNVDLTILANGAPYTEEPYPFNFFGCPVVPGAEACGSQCTARAGCGWCISQSTCTADFLCNQETDFFVDKCYNVTVSPNIIRAGSNQTINVQFNQGLPFKFTSNPLLNTGKRSVFDTLQQTSTDPTISCRFGSASVPAIPNTNTNPDAFSCQSPVILQEGVLPFTVLWNGFPLVEPVNFEITNCGGYSSNCADCITKPSCNWCFESNTCTESDICPAGKWGGGECPSIVVTDPQARAGLIAGVVIGGAVLIAGAIFLILFLRWRKKKQQGLVLDVSEPDYSEVAFKSEATLQYKITAKDDYEELENILMNRDRTFIKAVAAVTSATEDDAVSRALTFIAHHRKVASDMIQYFASDEVMKAKSENTIFRQDSLSSKMFKYYSKIVGTRYLFFMLARVINELNELAENAEAAEKTSPDSVMNASSSNLLSGSSTVDAGNDLTASEGKSKRSKKKSVIVYEGTEINRASASLLNFDMELDPVLLENKEVDTEANVYQLELATQKILTVIINNENKVPREFREIFVRIENAIQLKFGNETAAYKAVGGFLFLRFICPAITVPQYYGLIKEIPNKKCQRQLILIAKVLQNMANLATLSHKETFMKDLEGFMAKNQPKFVELYQNLLNPEKLPDARARLAITVPENARLNSLAFMHQHIHRSERKLRQHFEQLAQEDADKAREMNKLLDEIVQNYGEPPKKKEDKQ